MRSVISKNTIRTIEAKLIGELAYPVKPLYDMAKRTLGPLDMILPTALFEERGDPPPGEEPAEPGDEEGSDEAEAHDNEPGAIEERGVDPPLTGGAASSGGHIPPTGTAEDTPGASSGGHMPPTGTAGDTSGAIPGADAAADGCPRFKVDTSGRRYRIDEYGNRILAGNRRPSYIPSEDWTKMSKKRKDEAHAEWMAKGAKDAANAASEAARGLAGSGPSLPAAAATQQDGHRPAINEKRHNPNMMLMIMCGLMGMVTGIEPNLERMSSMSGELKQLFHDTSHAPAAANAAAVNEGTARQDDANGKAGEYTPSIRAYPP
jgi:hypothetical protein